ncbi:MAG: prolipoprotein diacylglyceryl transferase [Muribaculaceae bacterium]
MLNFITWTVNPTIIDSFVTIRWYGLAFAIGFLIGYEIVSRIYKHEGVPESWMGSLFVYVVIATIIGSRLGHVFFYEWDYYSQNPIEIFKIWEGGLASHGGTIGIIIAIFLYSKFVTHKSALWTFDRLVVPVALVGALIRFGNLMNHEIYGGVTDMPWGFSFVQNVGAWMQGAEPIFTQPSHPTQIYEALCYLALFGVMMFMYWKKNEEERPGLIFGVFLTWLFTARFLIEFVKNDQELWEENMLLNMGQILSIPFMIAGVILIIRALNRPRETLTFPNKFAPEKKLK